MLPKARELLAEQCTTSRPVKDVVGLAFERQGALFATLFSLSFLFFFQFLKVPSLRFQVL